MPVLRQSLPLLTFDENIMIKKVLFLAVAVIGISSAVIASGNVQVLSYYDCNCCEGSQSSSCYVMQDDIVLSCGKGLNICDMDPID